MQLELTFWIAGHICMLYLVLYLVQFYCLWGPYGKNNVIKYAKLASSMNKVYISALMAWSQYKTCYITQNKITNNK